MIKGCVSDIFDTIFLKFYPRRKPKVICEGAEVVQKVCDVS